MIRLFRVFVYLLIGLLAYWIIPPRQVAWAAGEFRADYDVQYAVSPSGTTIVTQNITLTNKLTNLYPEKYAILIDSTNIKNVVAYDRRGPITPEITRNNDKTEILLVFNEKVVGVGKQLTFTLRFENSDIAQKNGAIWEINIPGIANDPDIGDYRVSLNVPPTFGPNAYMTPLPSPCRRWTKEQMKQGGISAAYGTTQYFTVDLAYHLENTKVTPAVSEVALPPDTAYQTVTIKRLDPKPATIVRDADGNWLARYELTPGQTLDVVASLRVAVELNPRQDMIDPVGRESFLKADRYWEIDDVTIRSLANEFRTPRAIYDFVVKKLQYDYERVKQSPIRKGAAGALATPDQSICMEFTDLFIAIARAAGIPAREVIGYAYTTNSTLRPLSLVADVLHAWPEYYDDSRGVWVAVDPTWAKTTGGVNYFDKLDFNHIAFVIHGTSSTYPYPAGSYRKEQNRGKDVNVRFAETPSQAASDGLRAAIEFPTSIVAGFAASGALTVENTGGTSVDQLTISLQSAPVDVRLTEQKRHIPPFATIRIPFSIKIPTYATATSGRISASVNDKYITLPFTIRPLYWMIAPVGIAVLAVIVGLWLWIARPFGLWKHPKSS